MKNIYDEVFWLLTNNMRIGRKAGFKLVLGKLVSTNPSASSRWVCMKLI